MISKKYIKVIDSENKTIEFENVDIFLQFLNKQFDLMQFKEVQEWIKKY